jgi:broad specificity phosphatase PhoE
MAHLYLVRHGEPAAHWGGGDPDPGLSALGLAQAAHAAGVLKRHHLRTALTSPLRRCVETAAAFEMETGAIATVTDAVREVPTPAGVGDRSAWLAGAMAGDWPDFPDLAQFRDGVVARLLSITSDAAIFSHYVAINVAVGAATGRDAVMVCRPAHASITILSNEGGRLTLVESGAEAPAVNAL